MPFLRSCFISYVCALDFEFKSLSREFSNEAYEAASKSAGLALNRGASNVLKALESSATAIATVEISNDAADAAFAAYSTIDFLYAAQEDLQIRSNYSARDCLHAPLWGSNFVLTYEQIIDSGVGFLFDDPRLAFWSKWYLSLVEGKHISLALLREIALIDPDDWDAGPERVALRIEEIEARYLSEATGLAERVDINPETGLLRVTPVPLEDAPLVAALLGNVETILDVSLAVPSNGLRETSFVPALIRATIARHANDPQRIEMSMVTAATTLRRQFETEDLPRSEGNTALLDAVEETARGVRGAHPEVAAARERLARQAWRELPDADRAKLREALPLLSVISEDQKRRGYQEDIPALVATRDMPPIGDAPPLPGMDPAARVFSRIAATSELLRSSRDAIHAVERSTGFKAAQILGTLASLVAIGLTLYRVL